MLQVSGVSKFFSGVQVLDQASFTVQEGEIVGLIGPNGAGKTTLLEAVAGLIPTERGAVSWRGRELSRDGRKDHLFYLPDGIIPYEDRKAGEVLEFFAMSFRTASYGAVGALALEPVLNKRVGTLSKGYRKRLLLAIARVSTQPLLLLDEPFDGFDFRQVLHVMDWLKDVRASGRTLLLSIHQLNDAEKMCERLILLSAGKIIGVGTLDELKTKAGISQGGLEEVFLALT